MQVSAIVCSDLHLSHKAPVARSAEPDWYAAMKRALDEVKHLADDNDTHIIVCGDILDRWNAGGSTELINFAVDAIQYGPATGPNPPEWHAIPGQHDLPNHNLADVGKSAYGVLTKAGLRDLTVPVCDDGIQYYPFPWSMEVGECDRLVKTRDIPKVTIIHSYIWKQGSGYPGAPDGALVSNWMEKLRGYDAAFFGDNHKGFILKTRDISIMNCGTLMRRKSDEVDYRPMVGLLYEDGSIEPHYLDISKDKFSDSALVKEVERVEIDATKFLAELRSMGADSLDFRDAVNRYLDSHGVSSEVRQLVAESMDGGQ